MSQRSTSVDSAELHRFLVQEWRDYAILATDPAGVLVTSNPGVEGLLGYRQEELLGQNIAVLFTPEDRLARIPEQELDTAREHGRAPSVRWQLRRDGSLVLIDGVLHAIRTPERQLVAFAKVMRDITPGCGDGGLIQTILEITDQPIFIKDRNGRYVLVNRAVASIIGREVEEVIGKTDAELQPEELSAKLEANDRQVIESGPRTVEETMLVHGDGETTYLTTKAPWRSNEGNVVGLIGIAQDIADRKRAERALRASEERLRLALDIDTVGVLFFDLEGNIHDANDAFLRMSGYTREDLKRGPLRWDQLTPEEWMPASRQTAHQLATTGKAAPYVKEYIRKDGTRRWGLFSPRMLDNREAVEFVVDITDQKLAEAHMAETAALLNLAQDAISSVRMDGTIDFWNRGAEELYGWSRQEAIGRNIHELLRTEFSVPLQQILGTLVRSGSWAGELKHHTRDGRVLNVLTRWALRPPDGRSTGWLEIARDITEWRRLEEQLRETQKLESLGVLAGGVAHDFNNLLTGIIGNISLGLDIAPLGSSLRQVLVNALQASEKAAYLVKQMLAYAGKSHFLTFESLHLAEVVREAVRLVRGSIPAGVDLEFDFQADPCCVRVDRTQVHQVAMNLILNAAEAIGERVGKILVRLGSREVNAEEARVHCDVGNLSSGRYVVLEVRDTGPGIDPGIRPKIFDPFFTTKFAGRGLGLAATAGIVRTLNGAIQVESAERQGTGFRVFLPMVEGEAPAERSASYPVLIVDDEEVVRQAASAMLRSQGYKVVLAENGRRAVDVFREREGRFALVLLDLTMPVMSGPETIPELKAIRPDVPVVISTGLTEETAQRRFGGFETAGFIQKPYTLNALVEKVRTVIGERNRG